MSEGPTDIVVAVFQGPCSDVRFLMENKRYVAAVILMFTAIDAFAQAMRRNNKDPRPPQDFQSWVEKYILIPGNDNPNPQEWWSARCALVHSYGLIAKKHKINPGHRAITWFGGNEKKSFVCKIQGEEWLFVNISSFHDAFQKGVQRSLEDAMKDSSWKNIVENRLSEFIQHIKVDENDPVSRFLNQR